VIRALAGTHESPIGTVIGVSSEHDPVAGTQRGHNTIYVFELGGPRLERSPSRSRARSDSTLVLLELNQQLPQ
jgi:hypothetical protein